MILRRAITLMQALLWWWWGGGAQCKAKWKSNVEVKNVGRRVRYLVLCMQALPYPSHIIISTVPDGRKRLGVHHTTAALCRLHVHEEGRGLLDLVSMRGVAYSFLRQIEDGGRRSNGLRGHLCLFPSQFELVLGHCRRRRRRRRRRRGVGRPRFAERPSRMRRSGERCAVCSRSHTGNRQSETTSPAHPVGQSRGQHYRIVHGVLSSLSTKPNNKR